MNSDQARQYIIQEIKGNDIVLFMKGTVQQPLCGFSSNVVRILQSLKVIFKGINVLTDNYLREEIKSYSEWPTIPQLYIKEEFIGGSDIVQELYLSGELQNLLRKETKSDAI